jgi:ubiquinone/menaquinone biosynthesis C-methylase UbiE
MADEQNFFTDGAAYRRMMGRWSVLAGEVFLGWLAQPKGLRWLDVGCGTGAFTELLVANCAPAEVQGLDPSASQIAYARARQGASLAHFRQGDAQALPFADDSFDVAVMALVISFVPDPAKAVAEMARTVRPGGWIATYMWDGAGGGIADRTDVRRTAFHADRLYDAAQHCIFWAGQDACSVGAGRARSDRDTADRCAHHLF